MPSTTRYRRGDIVLVAFPFTDLTSTKRRPALVVSPDSFNDQLEDLVLVALTSRVSESDSIQLDASDCVDGMLPKRSAVRVTKMFTMHSSLIVKKICAVKPDRLGQILAAIREFFSGE
jgi:mRNA interferase MazF